MKKGSLCRSILVLALCGIAPACISSGAPDADDDLLAPGKGPVHKTPSVPVVIDGVRYDPEGIHVFDGRPLHMIVDLAEPDVLVGFTRQSDFRDAVEVKKKAARDSSDTSQLAGQYADYYDGNGCGGNRLTINSAWGVNDLRAMRRGCNIFGWCVGDWNDTIFSLWINGSQTLNADIQYGGSSIWVGGWGCLNLSPYGFDNIGSSLNVWW